MPIFDELKSLFERDKIKEDTITDILTPIEYAHFLHQIKKRLQQGEHLTAAIKSELVRLYTTPKVPDSLIKPLNQITSLKIPVFEGGNMFSDVGKIYKNEIGPTLDFISQKLGTDVKHNVIGSAGKNEYSGDLDIGMQINDVNEFFEKVKNIFGGQNCRKQGQLVSVKVPIQNFDQSQAKQQPRTGFVQVDFFPGDVGWLKFFHHVPSQDESKYKGAHRNLAITSITPYIGRQASSETDDDGRPIELVRYKWSPDVGLVKILRKSIKNNKGGWLKKQEDEMLSKPTKDPNQIANILFHGKFGAEALNSFESIVEAIKKSYDKNTRENIFRNIAQSFRKSLSGYENWNYPPEIQKYL
jgi:hypothetical protein